MQPIVVAKTFEMDNKHFRQSKQRQLLLCANMLLTRAAVPLVIVAKHLLLPPHGKALVQRDTLSTSCAHGFGSWGALQLRIPADEVTRAFRAQWRRTYMVWVITESCCTFKLHRKHIVWTELRNGLR